MLSSLVRTRVGTVADRLPVEFFRDEERVIGPQNSKPIVSYHEFV